MAEYTIFENGKTLNGDAKSLLEQIRQTNATESQELAKMNVDQYARALIEDAPYFLPDDLLDALEQQKFDSDHDRALELLDKVTTSGIRILSRRETVEKA